MARGRKGGDIAAMVAQLAGLLVLIGFVTPQGRQVMYAFGALVLGVLGIAFLGLIAFAIYRMATRAKGLQVATAGASTARLAVATRPLLPAARLNVDLHGSPKRSSFTPPKQPVKPELTERLRTIDWFQFEKLVALAYQKHGYTVARRGGANPDGGIDLLIRKDGETQAVQCKQWKSWKVGVKTVREFLGALTDAQIKKGIIITLCGATDEGRTLAAKHGIGILDEQALASLLEKVDARYDPKVLAILEDPRKFCPKCEHEMVVRAVKRGAGAGQQFWGCSTYPRCRFTMPFTS